MIVATKTVMHDDQHHKGNRISIKTWALIFQQNLAQSWCKKENRGCNDKKRSVTVLRLTEQQATGRVRNSCTYGFFHAAKEILAFFSKRQAPDRQCTPEEGWSLEITRYERRIVGDYFHIPLWPAATYVIRNIGICCPQWKKMFTRGIRIPGSV